MERTHNSFVKNIPNMITCCNLISGCIAVGAAFHGNFSTAFLFILIGAFFDFFDGLTARALGVSGRMGLELDSLADVVTFGVAPSAMIFVLFTKVYYPSFMSGSFWFHYLPFTAFLMAAFSAYRLAKFNIDERQHTSFIGMPTPANAIFWSALINGCGDFLVSPRFNSLFLFAFVIMFSCLLVCEIPMFALKFSNMTWKSNKIKFIFMAICIVVLLFSLIYGVSVDNVALSLTRGLALCIGIYLVMSIGSFMIGGKH